MYDPFTMYMHSAGEATNTNITNTDVTFCAGPRKKKKNKKKKKKTIKLDEKATLRNRYNPVPHPALDTK